MEKRITVATAELATAMTVWLRVMPKRIWRELEVHHLAAKEKRQGERPDAERAVAEHLAKQFERADWQVTHPEPKALGSFPPWSGSD